MKTIKLKATELPNLDELARSRIRDGAWSLVQTEPKKGLFKLYIQAENKTFELNTDGMVNRIFDNSKFKDPIIAMFNVS